MASVRRPLRFIAVMAVAIGAPSALIAGCDLGAVPGVGETDGGGSGSGSGSGSGDDTAAAMAFTNTIMPIVTTKMCAQAACHGGVQPPKLTNYADLKMSSMASGNRYLMKPGSTNIFITKATLLNGGTTHPVANAMAVQYLDATEQAAFTTFIDTYGQ